MTTIVEPLSALLMISCVLFFNVCNAIRSCLVRLSVFDCEKPVDLFTRSSWTFEMNRFRVLFVLLSWFLCPLLGLN